MRSLFIALCLILASTAQAGVVTMTFAASNFSSGAPVDPVGGTMTWRAASQTAPIEELLSVNLTIAGYTYSVAEIGFNDFFQIGGLVSGITGVDAGAAANDFSFRIDPGTEQMISPFIYGLQSVTNQIWFSQEGTVSLRFEEGGPVPEPGTLALVALAVLGAAGAHRAARRSA